MSWMLSMWVAAALLALCMGESSVLEGMSLSASGYHLCVYNQTRNVSFLAIHRVPYTVTQPCGDWLQYKMCSVTVSKVVHQTEYRTVTEEVTGCCHGYEQVGRYCALSANRSGDFTTKPGSCPTAEGGSPGSEACEWDLDCTGWQKCCHRLGCSYCTNPAGPSNFSQAAGQRFNATVTVKIDYQTLMSKNGGHLDHVRLLQAMVTGALQADVSVYFLSSWPVHPYRTATSLLIESNTSLYNATSKLHLLLAHIQEVSSVSVEDMNECAQPALHLCSPHANCTNTEGSYFCTCRQAYTDVDPRDPGVHCRANVSESSTTELPQTCLPPRNTTNTSSSSTTQDPVGNSTVGFIMTTGQSNTASVPSSHTPQGTSPAPYTTIRSTVEPTLLTTICAAPSITSLWSAKVTGTSFSVSWSSSSHTIQTYQIAVSRGSEVVYSNKTNETMMEFQGLQPGTLYNVTVTPYACGSHGQTFSLSVKTDAQTLDATTRLTNIEFTAELLDSSSQAYRNLTETFRNEIYLSLPADIKDIVDSGQARIEITGIRPGSVVVSFSLIVTPSQSQNISRVSTAVMNSLLNITLYTVDKNNTSIDDFDECASGENDCSQWAMCNNTWASYTCVCLSGFIDRNTERPGRACQAIPTEAMTTPLLNPTRVTTVSTAPFSLTTPTTDPALITVTTTPETTTVIISTSEALSTVALETLSAVPAAPVVIPTQASTTPIPTTTAAPTTVTTASVSTISATETITTTSAPTTTTPATTTTTAATITNFPAPATTFPAPTTTFPAPTTTFPAPTTTPTSAKSSPVSATNIPAPTTPLASTTTFPAPTTTAPASATITSSVAISTPARITTTSAPTTRSTAAVATPGPTPPIPASITPTSALKTTRAASSKATYKSVTTIPAVSSTRAAPKTTTLAPSTTSDTQKTTFKIISPSVTPAWIPKTTTMVKKTTTTALKTTKTSHKTTTPAVKYSTAISSTTPIPQMTALITHSPASRITTNTSVLGAISVQCRVAAITVTIARDFLKSNSIKESALYLGQPACGVNGGNDTHTELTVAWNECVTRLVHNETFYTASATLFSSMDPSGQGVVPKIQLKVPIMCTYMKNMLISTDFGSMGYDMIKDVIMGSGSFQVKVQLMNGTTPLPQNYSLSSEEDLVVEVSLNTSSEQIKVVINKCWATPTPNPGDSDSHIFLENSCSLNSQTKVLENGNSSSSRVSVKIFSIVKLNLIYLHCQVHICVQTGSDTCVPDCLKRTARSSNTIGTALGSSGPVQRSDEDFLDDELNSLHIAGLACLGIGVSLFFIIGFVCLFYYQRNRIGHYNFSVKPKQENFTYLVFNA